MILARKFTQAENNDYESLVSAHGRLRAILDSFAEGILPPEYSPSILADYVGSVIAVQNEDGSFSVSKSPSELKADERDDALRFVSWVATALLCKFRNRHPEEAAGVQGLDESISRGLNWVEAADFSFPESGPAEAVQQAEAAFILAAGEVPVLLKAQPELAPNLAAGLKELTSSFRDRLNSGDTVLPGGIDYRTIFEKALAALTVD